MSKTAVPALAAALLALCAAASAAPASPRAQAVNAEDWRTWWGRVSLSKRGVFTLDSRAPTSPLETHSALATSDAVFGDHVFSFTATTLDQLRTGSAPNPWEVAWAFFRFRDLENYYYFILKPNGVELGKKQGSDAQIFLVTRELPRLTIGERARVRIRVEGARIRIWVDGAPAIDYVDPRPLPAGSVGLYEEDARVRFESVAVAPL
jgi:hypothetical protein